MPLNRRAPQSTMFFGPGTDGDVVISGGTTTLAGDKYYRNLTIAADGILKTNGWRIYCQNVIINNGLIHNKGNAASGVTAGSGATGQGSLRGFIGGGAGGSGNTAGQGNAGTNLSNCYGGAGGKGGTGSSAGATPGAAGTSTAPAAQDGGLGGFTGRILSLFDGGVFDTVFAQMRHAGAGGGGGSGGNGTTGTPGGGGGGGGCVWIAAPGIVGSGLISVDGGAGANAVDGGDGLPCGGGGGGGGVIILITNYPVTQTLSVAGGAAGTGVNGSTAPDPGAVGRFIKLRC